MLINHVTRVDNWKNDCPIIIVAMASQGFMTGFVGLRQLLVSNALYRFFPSLNITLLTPSPLP